MMRLQWKVRFLVMHQNRCHDCQHWACIKCGAAGMLLNAVWSCVCAVDFEFFYSSCVNPRCTAWRRVYRTCDGLIHSEKQLKVQKIYSQFQRKCGLQFTLIALIWHRILLFFSESGSHYGRPVRVPDQHDILRPSRLVRNSPWNKNTIDSISFLCIRCLMPQPWLQKPSNYMQVYTAYTGFCSS